MKEKFIKALNTLLYSWGGDTPPDAIWAANDFLDYYEEVLGVTIHSRFVEDDSLGENQELLDYLSSFN
jgi:hypothetical protein